MKRLARHFATESGGTYRARVAGMMLLGAVLLSLSGCGNGLARVTGKITLDGEPLAHGEDVSATICFFPEGSTGAPATAQIDDDGSYYVTTGSQTGIEPGAYVVTVRASQFAATGNPNFPRASRLLTPTRYNHPNKSGLHADVSAGSNTFDIEMESK